MVLVFLVITDYYLLFLFQDEIVFARREMAQRFSNGDENEITLYLKNNHFLQLQLEVIDEIPTQFQIRDFNIGISLTRGKEKEIKYYLKPLERGEYDFGHTNVYITTPLHLLKRREKFSRESTMVKVYPSFLKMRKYEFLAISNRLTEAGIKRVRKAGTRTEFDQIKEYVKGDNYRTINWKATAKKARLMVNKYQEERSQHVYNLIDMGRIMKMPFNGMSLLDYAINSALIISNTAILKHDKPGIITFNKSVNAFQKAERKGITMHKILETLYNQQTLFLESDYEYLAVFVKKHLKHRSLLVLYTNFEYITAVHRRMKYLRNLASNHLLLVVVYENTAIKELLNRPAENLQQIYHQTIAEKYEHEKKLIIKELNKHGILTIYTPPGELTPNLINKYLEIKHKGIF
jgi:uncharacterized protein (DUF58 family)